MSDTFDPAQLSNHTTLEQIEAMSVKNLKSLIDYRTKNYLYMDSRIYDVYSNKLTSNKSNPVYNRQDPTDYREKPVHILSCTCGARHTSRPSYHLDWCDIK